MNERQEKVVAKTQLILEVDEDIPSKLAELAGRVELSGSFITTIIRRLYANMSMIELDDTRNSESSMVHLQEQAASVGASLKIVEEMIAKEADKIRAQMDQQDSDW